MDLFAVVHAEHSFQPLVFPLGYNRYRRATSTSDLLFSPSIALALSFAFASAEAREPLG